MRHTITAAALAVCFIPVAPASFAGTVDGGSRHTCALDSAGLAWCWGSDDIGQQGSGPLVNPSATPVQVSGLQVYKEISSAGEHSCALKSNGEVRCWGKNENGRLGDGTYVDRNEPVVVAGYTAAAISAGADATCGLGLDGLVSCWGYFVIADPGSLGDPNSPKQIAIPGAQSFKSIAVGELHACAVDTAGQAWCWGNNPQGQLGIGTSGEMNMTPTAVQQPGGVEFDSVVAGKSHTCAIDTAGRAWCWGEGSSGQLGQGSADAPAPSAVVLEQGISMQQLAAGDSHTCGIDQHGRVWCWGANETGVVGNPANRLLFEPTRVSLPSDRVFESIGSGERSTCATTKQGEVWCWGDGMRGELALGYFGHTATPVSQIEFAGASSLTSGAFSSCQIDFDGMVECWGANFAGQLGRGNTEDSMLPTRIDASGLPANTKFGQVDAGRTHVCALDDDGKPWCWGSNADGQLGIGSAGPYQTKTSPVASAVLQLTAFTRLSAGGHHTCAIDLYEQLWCWGWNAFGQLGIGSAPDKDPTPQQITEFGQLAFSDVSAGGTHTCAVEKTNGSIYCWGFNGFGQLGQNDTTNRDVPTILPFLGNVGFSRVVAGGDTTCAAQTIPNDLTKSELWCWGENGNGQVGDGTTTDRLVPTYAGVVKGSGDTLKPGYIALGEDHTCVRRPNGTTACWGRNTFGQLGDGSTQDHLSGVITLFEDGQIEEIAAGAEHTCTLNTLGQLACAGSRKNGQLADDTMGYLVPPKAIPGFVALSTTLFQNGFEQP